MYNEQTTKRMVKSINQFFTYLCFFISLLIEANGVIVNVPVHPKHSPALGVVNVLDGQLSPILLWI